MTVGALAPCIPIGKETHSVLLPPFPTILTITLTWSTADTTTTTPVSLYALRARHNARQH